MGKQCTMQTNVHNYTCQHYVQHDVYIHMTVGTCMAVKILDYNYTYVALCLKLKAITSLHYCSNWQRLPLPQGTYS